MCNFMRVKMHRQPSHVDDDDVDEFFETSEMLPLPWNQFSIVNSI